MAKEILKVAELPDKGDGFRALNDFANIRNSLHRNGVHNCVYESDQKINGMQYVFENNKKIECASWKHILNILDATIEALDKILLSDKIKTELNYEVIDVFAAQMK